MKLDIINVDMIKFLFTWGQVNFTEISVIALIGFMAFCWVRADRV